MTDATVDTAADAGRACPACGYDLRGSTSDRCPECGVRPAAASAVPWAHRRRLGVLTALARTVWLATVRPGRLATAGLVDPRDARSFAAWTGGLFVVGVEAVAAGATAVAGGTGHLNRVTVDLLDWMGRWNGQRIIPADWMILWPAGATQLWVPPLAAAAGAWVWAAGVTRLAGGGPRSRPVAAYVAAAPLAWVAVAVVAGGAVVGLDHANAARRLPVARLAEAAAVAVFLPAALLAVVGGWWGPTRVAFFVGRPLGTWRAVATTVALPVVAAAAVLVAAVGAPCIAGLVWIMFDGLRG